MALTPSTEMALGTAAPNFSLPDTNGNFVSLDNFAESDALIVAFWCNHCPFVKHIKNEFSAFAREYQAKNVAVVAINANDIEHYPHDGPKQMREDIEQYNYCFAYVLDESQTVASAYNAACTPDIYLFDRERKLIYHGQFDASRPNNDKPIDGADLRNATSRYLAGAEALTDQTPCIGCNIKWKTA